MICGRWGRPPTRPEVGVIDDATLFFGIAMDGPWIVPQSFLTNIGIDVDTDLDDVTDYELTHGSSGDVLVTGDITERELADDAYYTIIDSLDLEKPKLGGLLNVFPSAEQETSLLNNSVMIYSVQGRRPRLGQGKYADSISISQCPREHALDRVRRRPPGAAYRQPVTRALAVSRCGFASGGHR